MGSYLSEPITEKISEDQETDKLAYGASSMQGWRESQEDAHNSILDFDENTAYFAVYDGHGGHEVAEYCSKNLPDFIKNTEAYKAGDYQKALIEGFLGFDSTIASENVISVLKELAARDLDESDSEENVKNLYEEASMPIEKVMEKYTNLIPALVKSNKRPLLIHSKAPKSTKNEEAGSSKNSIDVSDTETSELLVTEFNGTTEKSDNEINGDEKKEDLKDPLDISEAQNGSDLECKVSCEASIKNEENKDIKPVLNGDIENQDLKTEDDVEVQKEEIVTNKAKGKAILKKVNRSPINTRPKRNATQLYQKLLDNQDSEESEDEEDKTFVGPGEDSSDEEGEGVAKVEFEGSDDETSEEEDAEDEEVEGEEDDANDDDEEEEEEEEEVGDGCDEEDFEFAKNMKEEPGSDSGCTAVVALLKGTELYVANAGDSRCIICRKGQAIEMSFDHKPEDEPERDRILKAGGKVTLDGRVNGGLNLSRAIGDHAYKQNKDLNDREQMITALPDVKTLTINPSEDEFMVLACDGIWNFMSSQEVVDFVKPRLDANSERISHICEEMFDHCLAPNTMGDGTGCDNMTAIIVKFKPNIKKRQATSESDADDLASKRPKANDSPEEKSS